MASPPAHSGGLSGQRGCLTRCSVSHILSDHCVLQKKTSSLFHLGKWGHGPFSPVVFLVLCSLSSWFHWWPFWDEHLFQGLWLLPPVLFISMFRVAVWLWEQIKKERSWAPVIQSADPCAPLQPCTSFTQTFWKGKTSVWWCTHTTYSPLHYEQGKTMCFWWLQYGKGGFNMAKVAVKM